MHVHFTYARLWRRWICEHVKRFIGSDQTSVTQVIRASSRRRRRRVNNTPCALALRSNNYMYVQHIYIGIHYVLSLIVIFHLFVLKLAYYVLRVSIFTVGPIVKSYYYGQLLHMILLFCMPLWKKVRHLRNALGVVASRLKPRTKWRYDSAMWKTLRHNAATQSTVFFFMKRLSSKAWLRLTMKVLGQQLGMLYNYANVNCRINDHNHAFSSL